MRWLLAPAAALLLTAAAAPERWIAAWTAPPIGYEPRIRDGLGRPYRDETVRQVVRAGIAGRTLRIRLSNELGDTPLRLGGASIVRLDAAGAPVPGSWRALRFAGAADVIIPARAPYLSDAVAFPVAAGERFAVTVHYPGEAEAAAHAQMVDVAPGNQTGSVVLTDAKRARASGIVSGVEVTGSRETRVLVAFGDSITEGAGATQSKAMSWPDQLQRLLAASPGGRCWSVANAGISGNRLLNNGRGPNALSRFERDVLVVPGVTHVVFLEGINDIGRVSDPARAHEQASAAQLIAAHRQLLARAKAAGLKVIVGTLLPYEGAAYADAEGEQRRQAVNRWIRANARQYDAVIDFDVAMQEPGKPGVMRLAWQIGDHLHPNDAGYTAMAKTALPVVLRQGCGG
ncbi:SGNH/GDSL hydrolase family protein [Sphingomonas koreensis]|uniref:SGNH/GDSL hydrolase family protein n=1 Tax=Sphingomonas koreensis TaxID=93064 RepID=A0A430FZ89_9SPHN|nr:SGNH/GDSL hydrolase family protein [Sphingomonas koreensis]RSY78361.1 SGNH/GDSL hydrolase family protein [Sphingomonas koreensis]